MKKIFQYYVVKNEDVGNPIAGFSTLSDADSFANHIDPEQENYSVTDQELNLVHD